MNKRILTLLLTSLCVLPAFAARLTQPVVNSTGTTSATMALTATVPERCFVDVDAADMLLALDRPQAYEIEISATCNRPYALEYQAKHGELRHAEKYTPNDPKSYLRYTVEFENTKHQGARSILLGQKGPSKTNDSDKATVIIRFPAKPDAYPGVYRDDVQVTWK